MEITAAPHSHRPSLPPQPIVSPSADAAVANPPPQQTTVYQQLRKLLDRCYNPAFAGVAFGLAVLAKQQADAAAEKEHTLQRNAGAMSAGSLGFLAAYKLVETLQQCFCEVKEWPRVTHAINAAAPVVMWASTLGLLMNNIMSARDAIQHKQGLDATAAMLITTGGAVLCTNSLLKIMHTCIDNKRLKNLQEKVAAFAPASLILACIGLTARTLTPPIEKWHGALAASLLLITIRDVLALCEKFLLSRNTPAAAPTSAAS